MSPKTAPHDLAERPVYGTPRVVPFVLFCLANPRWCGRYWIANTWEQYDELVKGREVHHRFCGAATVLDLKLPI